jgi:hypothetical protein
MDGRFKALIISARKTDCYLDGIATARSYYTFLWKNKNLNNFIIKK